MSYAIFTGKQRSLVFPIMCNGFLTLDYTDNIVSTGTGIPYGLWDLDDNFTFECVLTPYEINGYGIHRTTGSINKPSNITQTTIGSGFSFNANNKKIMPGLEQAIFTATEQNNFESELYLPRASRITHEMRIFHSTNFQVSLVNDTLHNENNPARYKIKVGIKLGTASMEHFTSDAVIIPNLGSQYDSFVEKGFEEDGKVKYKSIGSTTSAFSSKTANLSNANQHVFDGKEVFIRDGFTFTSFGIVDSASSSALTLKLDPSVSVSSGSEIFIHDDFFEPSYINNTYHVACSWDNQNKEVLVFLDGRLVKTGTHTQTDSFTMEAEDFFIGANGGGATGANSATTNNQFMGELHELSFMNIRKTEFNGINNLTPNLNNTVLYLRFEEVDE
mgnify:FL=1|tara:strand:+ start:854 stop:2017 length:1164 start_codon:yes stop_codon:yes gene_type:complete